MVAVPIADAGATGALPLRCASSDNEFAERSALEASAPDSRVRGRTSERLTEEQRHLARVMRRAIVTGWVGGSVCDPTLRAQTTGLDQIPYP